MQHPAALNEGFNLSTSAGMTVLELAEIIWRKTKGAGVPIRVIQQGLVKVSVTVGDRRAWWFAALGGLAAGRPVSRADD